MGPTRGVLESRGQRAVDTLREAAIRKLADGTTTFEEVVRITADNA